MLSALAGPLVGPLAFAVMFTLMASWFREGTPLEASPARPLWPAAAALCTSSTLCADTPKILWPMRARVSATSPSS